ncbi:hypothetical protein BCR36DRAFT_272712 [Piromyces finnis]|uniref:Uncharacterized protein n=1 Tax=Piromyces finnis TaxID=1754191 RepID=A0A1Y1VPA4_9FUNG|nr:hypothetical protein BCR36DRAFT_272712 [Piromyces finnis]|eukprot:ORX61249.1 hypothetical protein BCR36DRAFT_272712 [Piromyces finnis]
MSEQGPPAIFKKYFPDGRPESLKKLFPNGPPPAELFEGDYPEDQIPPKLLALFPNGELPDDLKIFKENVPEDLKEFLVKTTRAMKAKLAAQN